ncbi:MAG: hypothetical protein COV36_04810 [Alphaproteobacteria bacterium CG11_big_fil_rev_8_21_14_0_20_44_7]|nr:MAG: hypothetical protein COV36_04810 [Alphaproteobacteria bacterium CG11_big_fil_rev_8_21_14_0_20_44_7]
MENDPLLTEIQEEVKRDRAKLLFERYGGALIIAGIAFILLLAGYKAWEHFRVEKQKAAGTVMVEVLSDENSSDNIEKIEEIGINAGYKQIGGLVKANILVGKGEIDQAVMEYLKIAEINGNDPAIADLAKLNAATLIINSNVTDNRLPDILNAISDKDRPFRYSGKELLAIYHIENGNIGKGVEILEDLINDENTPYNILQRNKDLLLKIKPENNDSAESEPNTLIKDIKEFSGAE